jgi:riboflavin transporter FmnP
MKKTNRLTLIAILGALGFILTLFEIPFPGTSWLKFDISDTIVLFGVFAGGPLVGIALALLKATLCFIIHGSSSAGVGEAVMIISSLAFIFPVYYTYKKTKKIFIALILGTISLTLLLTYVNYAFVTPFYAKLYKMDFILDMINKNDGSYLKYIIGIYAPFNLLKGITLTAVYLVIHKRLKVTYKL